MTPPRYYYAPGDALREIEGEVEGKVEGEVEKRDPSSDALGPAPDTPDQRIVFLCDEPQAVHVHAAVHVHGSRL